MDIKDLNKSQLILLTLLVSFVTSIATGIVTVTLLQQAPPSVTNTINRVVERTIEKVVPQVVPGKTQTVIIKEEDLVVDAISHATDAIGDIIIKTNGDIPATIAGEGFLIDATGTIITDTATVSGPGSYTFTVGTDTYDLDYIKTTSEGITVLSVHQPTDSKNKLKPFPFLSFADESTLKVGQTGLLVYKNPVSVLQTIITSITPGKVETSDVNITKTEDGTKTKTTNQTQTAPIAGLTVNQNIPKKYAGSPIINLDGDIIGVAVFNDPDTIILPANMILAAQKVSPAMTSATPVTP